jgi:hypothetical protein
MGRSRRIVNITTGFQLKPAQAQRAIENCAAVWVEPGVTIRSATLAEAIELRNRQAALRERLAYAELPGLIYKPALRDAEGHRRELAMAASANEFAGRPGVAFAAAALSV